jgi:hypothetical protein
VQSFHFEHNIGLIRCTRFALVMTHEYLAVLFYCRSKSRSVDHGFSPPFDLDSLRSKVEGRFESVGRGKLSERIIAPFIFAAEILYVID